MRDARPRGKPLRETPHPSADARALTRRQERFAHEFSKSLNATVAAAASGYSSKNARFQGARLLANVGVAAAIADILGNSLAAARLEIEKIDEAIANIAFADIRRLYRPDGALLPMDQWPNDVAAAVASLETTEQRAAGKRGAKARDLTTVVRKLRLADKVAVLVLARRRLGWLKDRVTLGGNVSLEALVNASFQPKPDETK